MRQRLLVLGFTLVFLGFAIVVVGSLSSGQVSTGGFVLIGPFPIVFGTGGNGSTLALLSVVAGLIVLFFSLLSLVAWGTRRRENA